MHEHDAKCAVCKFFFVSSWLCLYLIFYATPKARGLANYCEFVLMPYVDAISKFSTVLLSSSLFTFFLIHCLLCHHYHSLNVVIVYAFSLPFQVCFIFPDIRSSIISIELDFSRTQICCLLLKTRIIE